MQKQFIITHLKSRPNGRFSLMSECLIVEQWLANLSWNVMSSIPTKFFEQIELPIISIIV